MPPARGSRSDRRQGSQPTRTDPGVRRRHWQRGLRGLEAEQLQRGCARRRRRGDREGAREERRTRALGSEVDHRPLSPGSVPARREAGRGGAGMPSRSRASSWVGAQQLCRASQPAAAAPTAVTTSEKARMTTHNPTSRRREVIRPADFQRAGPRVAIGRGATRSGPARARSRRPRRGRRRAARRRSRDRAASSSSMTPYPAQQDILDTSL